MPERIACLAVYLILKEQEIMTRKCTQSERTSKSIQIA
jgi:hypothetical protein